MNKILCVICFDTKGLSVLFKTVIIQSDDHNVPHYMLARLLHMCRVNPSSDSDKVKVRVTCSHYHIRAPDAGLLKIDRCWASSPILDNKLFIFVESVHLQG